MNKEVSSRIIDDAREKIANLTHVSCGECLSTGHHCADAVDCPKDYKLVDQILAL